MISLEESQSYTSWTEVYDLVGERIPLLYPNNRVELGYTRTLFHPVLLRVTKRMNPNDIGLEIEGGNETPVLVLTTKEIRQLYKRTFELLYPLTWFLLNQGHLVDLYSEIELKALLEQKCGNLIERALKSGVNTLVDVPETLVEYYELDQKEYEQALQNLTRHKRVLSPLYTATPDHPECEALQSIIKDYPLLVQDTVLMSPFCLPVFAKNIELCSSLRNHFDLQTLFENSAPEEPSYHFTPVTSKIPEIYQRKEEFIQAVVGHCVGVWVYELDLSQSSVCGGAICHALSIILANPSQNTTHYDGKYRSFKLKHTEEIPEEPFSEYNNKQVSSNFILTYLGRNYKIIPASDVDIAVHDVDNFDQIVEGHFKVIGAYWPGILLTKSTNKYKVVSTNAIDYLNGFRDVEFYREAKYRCIQHHVPMVRAFYDGQLQATVTCLQSHLTMTMDIKQYNYHLGRVSAKSILKKYKQRGFCVYGCANNNNSKRIESLTVAVFPLQELALHNYYSGKYVSTEIPTKEYSCVRKDVPEKEELLDKLEESTFKVKKQREYMVVAEAPNGPIRTCVRQDLLHYMEKQAELQEFSYSEECVLDDF